MSVSARGLTALRAPGGWAGPVIGAVLLGSVQQVVTVTLSSELNVLVLGVPSHGMRAVLMEAAEFVRPAVPVVSLAKGVEQGTLRRMTEVIGEVLPTHLPGRIGVLTGPNLAREIAGQHDLHLAGYRLLVGAGTVAVGFLVLAAVGFLEVRKRVGVDRAVGQRHGELVGLPVVVQRG